MFDPRKILLSRLSSLESVVPVAIFFTFGFFNALTEGLGLTMRHNRFVVA